MAVSLHSRNVSIDERVDENDENDETDDATFFIGSLEEEYKEEHTKNSEHDRPTVFTPTKIARSVSSLGEIDAQCGTYSMRYQSSFCDLFVEEEIKTTSSPGVVDILYHDIMMTVLSFLPMNSLASFSQTARIPNFECFFFLQLTLERALYLPDSKNQTILSRLARLNPEEAQKLVNNYSSSNTSLQNHPFAQRLAYILGSQNGSVSTAALVMTTTFLGGALSSFMGTEISTEALLSVGLGGVVVTSTEILSSTANTLTNYLTTKPIAHPYQHQTQKTKQKPTGCAGAFARALASARQILHCQLKESRSLTFKHLSSEEQNILSTRFIDLCTADENLEEICSLVQQGVDPDGFYHSTEGPAPTCGVHTAAFAGASAVVDYLCSGVEIKEERDGGLCDVNLKDENGWTALHFAAGANNVKTVEVLAAKGASLMVEAGNGYTPYHWAQRLGNKEVMTCLEEMGANMRFELNRTIWLPWSV